MDRRRCAALLLTVLIAATGCDEPGVSPAPSRSQAPQPFPTGRTLGAVTIDVDPPMRHAEVLLNPAERFWPATLAPPASAPLLQDSPITTAVLLYQPWRNASSKAEPVYAYGEGTVGFHWARLDVNLTIVAEQRNGQPRLRYPTAVGSLSFRGEFAAFPQRNEVVVVTMRTGAVRHIALPGNNVALSWVGERQRLLVSSDELSQLLDVATGEVMPSKVRATDLVIPYGVADGMLALTDSAEPAGGPPLLQYLDDGGLVETGRVLVDDSAAGPFKLRQMFSNAFRYGGQVAVAVAGGTPPNPTGGHEEFGPFVTVIDESTGAVTHILWLTEEFSPSGVEVIGWLGPGFVLLHTQFGGLLAWDLNQGSVTQLTAKEDSPSPIAITPAWPASNPQPFHRSRAS